MGWMGFFDLSRRYEGLEVKDPWPMLATLVPWETFRGRLHAALAAHGLRTQAAERKSPAGRKPWDEVLIFEALVVQALYTLSDEQMQYQVRDRLSFMRFLELGLEDRVPDATTLWLYREALSRAGVVEQLFAEFEAGLAEVGRKSRIHRRPVRNRPLTERERQGNTTRSRVRARVEHVFGHQASAMGGKLVRTIGLVRAKAKVGMQNLAYNMSRFVHLKREAAQSA